MDYKNIEVSKFSNCKKTIPSETINIWRVLLNMTECIDIINRIRVSTDPKEIMELKQRLPAITVSGIFSQRKANFIEERSALTAIDIDGKDNPHILDMEDLKNTISALPYILYCGLSVSGKGVFCIIPIADPENHSEHFNALNQDFNKLDIIIDKACSDITRLRFLSYDPRPYVNRNAEVYEKRLNNKLKYENNYRKKSDKEKVNPIIKPVIKNDKIENLEDYYLKDILNPKIEKIPYIIQYHNNEDYIKDRILTLIRKVVDAEVDITVIYDDWAICCGVISRYFKESGRVIFHEVSKFYKTDKNEYTEEETDKIYDSFLRQNYSYSEYSLNEVAAKYGFNS